MGASPVLKPSPKPASQKPKLGLRAWMERVLVECDRAAAGFRGRPGTRSSSGAAALPVSGRWIDGDRSRFFMEGHEEGGEETFPGARRAARHAGDAGVDREAERIRGGRRARRVTTDNPGDPVVVKLLDHVHAREAECKQRAFKDLNQFDRKQWRQWARTLPQRASRVRPGSVVYLHLALEKWTAASRSA